MPEVFGTPLSRLREKTGSLAQVLRVDSFTESEGSARGARRFRLVNGGGLEFEVHPDRAIDIGRATIDGIPVSWISPSGITAPQFYESSGDGWLRTFGGGLLATCGLDTFGPPSEDDGREFGQHGRIGTQPAQILQASASEEGVSIEGTVRQSTIFGENLLLSRRISSAAGSDTIVVEDTVTNEGFSPAPHMILYHINLGWPLIDDDTIVEIFSDSVAPRDPDAANGMADRGRIGAPVPGFQEQLFQHRVPPMCDLPARVTNPRIGVELGLSYSTSTLPALFQWKMVRAGIYALGLEPANSPNIMGRAAARAAGELPVLEAGASVSYHLELSLRRVERSG